MAFIYITVACPSLIEPKNGVMTCLLGDDEVLSYEDICNFMCNVGYLISGSYTRTCQSDRSWSGTETMCRKGEIFVCIVCTEIAAKDNNQICIAFSFCLLMVAMN